MSKYNTLASARSSVINSVNFSKWSIIMGDDNLFWVVTNREASKLVRAGYEMVNIFE